MSAPTSIERKFWTVTNAYRARLLDSDMWDEFYEFDRLLQAVGFEEVEKRFNFDLVSYVRDIIIRNVPEEEQDGWLDCLEHAEYSGSRTEVQKVLTELEKDGFVLAEDME